MHILIVPSWYPTALQPIGGIFFKEQAQALQKYGYKVTVVFPELWSVKTIGKQKSPSGISFEIEDGLNTYRYRGYNFFPRVPYAVGILYYKRLKTLYKKIVDEQGKPDLIHAHSCLWGGWAAAKLSQKENLPFVITEHSSAFARNLIKPYQKKLVSYTLLQAKKVIVVGPGLKKELAKYVVDENKIALIPNIVNVDSFYPKQRTSILKKFRFFSLAILTQNKGMDILIQAFAKAFRHNQDVELIIGGDGEERKNLENLVRELKVENNVKLIGALSRDQVREQMQQCDAFVLASRYETFGVVFIEALACGKPIIATACGGPEMIVNEKNGLLVPVNDVEALGKALKYMVDQYEQYDPELIRRDCIEKYSEEAVVSKLNEIYFSRTR
ncbi:glycosyltransferase [Bacillaceae bacterium]